MPMNESLNKSVPDFEDVKRRLEGWCDYYAEERPSSDGLGEAHDNLMKGIKMVLGSWGTDNLLLKVSVMLAALQDMATKK